MTNEEVIKIWRTLNEVDFGEVSVRFSIDKARMIKKLNEFIEPFKEVEERINNLSKEARELLKKDEKGNPIVKEGAVDVIDGKEEEFVKLDKKIAKLNRERQELMQEDADIELGKLPLEEFPEKLEDKYTQALIPIIKEDE